eukprot:306281-Prymnesium_polylepis.1
MISLQFSRAARSRLFEGVRPLCARSGGLEDASTTRPCPDFTETSLELDQQITYVPNVGEPALILERAASGRSTCKACGVKIPKNEFRLSSLFAWQAGFLHIRCFGRVIGSTTLADWSPLEWTGLQSAMAESMPQYAAYHAEARAIRSGNEVARGRGVYGKPGYGTNPRAQQRRDRALDASYQYCAGELSQLLEERFLAGSKSED